MPVKYDVYPSERKLCWRAQESNSKTISIVNTSEDVDLLVDLPGPSVVGEAHFDWNPTPRFLLESKRSANWKTNGEAFSVKPPVPGPGTGPTSADVHLRIYDTSGNLIQDRSTYCRNDCVAKVSYGDIAIHSLVFNPPGSDLAGEGEYFEIENMTSRPLDMAGCYITQRVFRSSSSYVDRLRAFTPDPGRIDFGSTCTLAPKAILRVLTRRMVTGEGLSATRYYLDRANPIWNNTGDRVEVHNEYSDLLASFGYGSQTNLAPNLPAPPVVQIENPPPQQIIFSTEFNVDPSTKIVDSNILFMLEDGDTLTISTTEAEIGRRFVVDDVILPGTIGLWPFSPEFLPSGERLLILPRRIGGLENSPNVAGWPLPGAPVGALIALIGDGTPFVIGSGFKNQVTLNSRSELRLGVNDNEPGSNRGSFIAVVRVER